MKLIPVLLDANSDPILIEALRSIYVRTIESLATKPLIPPTPAEQLEWWKNLDPDKVRVWLWRDVERPWEPVAFSMLTDRGDHATPMFAIDPAFQGRNLARTIIAHYINAAGKPLRGEQLVSNEAIRKLNREAGWRVWGTDYRVEKLCHGGPYQGTYPDYDAILKGLDGP